MTHEVKLCKIGPKEAAELLRRNVSNRPLSPLSVERYVADMRNGRWVFNGDPLRFVEVPGEEPLLVDGQHRLQAVLASGTEQEFLVLTLPEETETEKGALYASIDSGKRRTLGDAFHTGRYRGQFSYSGERYVTAAIQALSIVEILVKHGSVAYGRMSNAERMQLFYNHEEEVFWAAQIREKQGRGMRPFPHGLLAGAILCYRAHQAEATRFFGSVASGANIAEGSPAWVLRNETLKSSTSRTRGGASSHAQHLWWVGVTLSAWRNWCDGVETIQILRPLKLPCEVAKPRRLKAVG